MSTVTRDEFETVKQLLASAARYAESANQKLDRVATQQDVNTIAIANLHEAQGRTQQNLERLEQIQERSQQQLGQLSVRVTQLSERVDSFVFESQRLHNQHAEKIEQLQGISERLEAILAYLVRKEGSGE